MASDDPRLPPHYWAKVVPEPNSGCWIWIGACSPNGYPQFWISPRLAQAHRVAYEALVGPIATGAQIDHLCRTRCCVNPAHLESVTQRENILRGTAPAARNAVMTHCKHGHAFTEENTRLYRGRRRCRACNKAWCLSRREIKVES